MQQVDGLVNTSIEIGLLQGSIFVYEIKFCYMLNPLSQINSKFKDLLIQFIFDDTLIYTIIKLPTRDVIKFGYI